MRILLPILLLLPSLCYSQYAPTIYEQADKHDIPPLLIEAICERESNWQWQSYNDSTGATGLCQVTPIAYEQVTGRKLTNPWILFDPIINIQIAVQYLRWCRNHPRVNNWPQAIECYGTGARELSSHRYGWQYPKHSYVHNVASAWSRAERLAGWKRGLISIARR